jgi:hypothetical protein
MIAETNNNVIIRSNNSVETFFSIKEENTAHIFSILRGQLYSDKLMAIIREYSTNALDAHVASGVTKPINISLPSYWGDGKFVVRDYGTGLSDDDIKNVFASYGESTKRNTNNQVGMLGLGSKSAFAYTSTFLITSYHNGIKNIYNAFIDESNKGVVALVSSSDTNETGLEITIPIKAQDSKLLIDKCYFFFRYWDNIPTFNNDNIVRQINTFKASFKTLEGDNWYIVKKNYGEPTLIVHMGNIAYPVSTENIILESDDRKLLDQNGYTIHLMAEIGDVTNSASRESLELNDKTQKWIINAITNINDEVQKVIQQKVTKCRSVFEAKAIYYDVSFASMGIQSYKYNGHTITNNMLSLPGAKIKVYYNTLANRARIDNHITCKSNTIYYVASPCTPEYTIKQRLIQNLGDSEKPTLIYFSSDAKADEFINNPDLAGANLVHVKTLPAVQSVKSRTPRVAMADAEYYSFNRYGSNNSDHWKVAKEVDLDEEQIYLVISRFSPERNGLKFDISNNTLSDLEQYGIKNIIGVKQKHIKSVGDSWLSISEALKKRADELYYNNEQEINKLLEAERVDELFKSMHRYNNYSSDITNPELKYIMELLDSVDNDYKSSNAYRDIKMISAYINYNIPYVPYIVNEKQEVLMKDEKINIISQYMKSPFAVYSQIIKM